LAVSLPGWAHVKELLHQALALEPEARARFLDEVCASSAALRVELESLLSVGDELNTGFLESPSPAKFGGEGEGFGAAGLAAGQLFEQRYQLVRRLGEGGMGQVWLAEQTAPVRRPVALKLIKAGMYDETVVHRLQAERQSLAIMDHPAIAKVFDAGLTPQGQPYFVMEYVQGLPITEYCDQHKLNIRERIELLIRACEGVQHAHQKAIIHRDLKPANILVVEVDGKPVPRIIDFGLAKATTSPLPDQTLYTRFGQFMGTPGYMSPEQVNPNIRDIDTRTDVYSLGVILYELLTGLQPFEVKGRQQPPLEEWLRQLREEEPRRPSSKVGADRESSTEAAAVRGTEARQLVSLLRGDLDWITMKALERDRDRRYATPLELTADLRRYLLDEPVVARSASAGYRLQKFVRRHRIAAGFLGMATVLSIISSGAAVIAVRQKHEAEFQAAQALQAQSRLLTQTAAQRLNNFDVAGAQGIILEVLTNAAFAQVRTPTTISVFQDIRAADAQIGVLSGHRDSVHSAAYSPDGTRIVTASMDKTVRIWDARTGAQLAVLSGHSDGVNSVAYSPDGKHILKASTDKTARIWDARTGTALIVLSGHGASIKSAEYSRDGTHIVTASFDKTARIWDARTGAQLAVLSGHGDAVNSAAYSPDGAHILTASDDNTARIWDARTGDQLAVLSGHGQALYNAAYSPDGTRIVSASQDQTVRIWDARVQANVAAQILWYISAETDPLPNADRAELGLPPDWRVRSWKIHGSACDQAAAAIYDPDRLTPGELLENITVDIANPTCSAEIGKPQHAARSDYQMGRTLVAKGDANGAKWWFEAAVSKGYRAARVDLADLLAGASVSMLDPAGAVSLYQKAWQDGVPVAAFRLGHLYEYGLQGSRENSASVALQPDHAQAWKWYQRGADAGEPNALARLAEREENAALAATDPSNRNAELLQAFKLYAAAAERAHEEDWPDDAWKYWRYRRASLARVLAQEGMMQLVADAYGAMLDKVY
jgi:eukaryotic-like serine/threonine-protein kinase